MKIIQLETERLILRELEETDAEEFDEEQEMLSDEDFKNALHLFKEGLDISAIPAIVENKYCATKYAKFSLKHNNKTASRLAVIERANEKNADLFATILDILGKNTLLMAIDKLINIVFI